MLYFLGSVSWKAACDFQSGMEVFCPFENLSSVSDSSHSYLVSQISEMKAWQGWCYNFEHCSIEGVPV